VPQGSAGHTIDHHEIRRWAERRGAEPGRRVAPEGHSSIGFRIGEEGSDLEPLGWDEFLALFDELGLAMLYRETDAQGALSTAHEFVER
jgi:hypothetical protein